jgi:RNA polymerase sigma-70 factor, ECF subfamily
MSESASTITPAFEGLYREHYPFVWKSVRRLGIPDAEVDDVVQDVFVVVHRRLGDFERRSSVRTWLFGIAYRVVRDKRRSFAARVNRERSVEEPRPPTEPDRKLSRHQAVAALDDLLAELDEDQRETFVMAEVVKMSAPEIAELTGVKLNTVYSRLRRAREAFEAALRGYLDRQQGELPWMN